MSANRGCLFIINIQKNRTNNDSITLENTFRNMNADVFVIEDTTGADIIHLMATIKCRDFTPYLYVAIAFLSHGTEDNLTITSDEEIIHIQKAILFPLCRNPKLDGKLKWLIMQTCRGSKDFLQETSEGPSGNLFPCYYAKFFATTEGMQAFRLKNANESIFIRALCERLTIGYRTRDILSILSDVIEDVIFVTRKDGLDQKPCSEDNFGTKKFYITSGFTDN